MCGRRATGDTCADAKLQFEGQIIAARRRVTDVRFEAGPQR
jgi:hypothetical protein